MARLDERLREDLERAASPADPNGIYEDLIRRRERRRNRRRIQAGALALAVFAASLWGVLALRRSIQSTPAVEPLTSGMLLFQRYVRCPDRPDLSTFGLEVMAVDVATGELRVVASGETLNGERQRSEEWPEASPDGRSFVWVDRYERDVFLTDISTGETRRLTRGLDARIPRFSADGSTILFKGRHGIYTMTLDGSEPTLVGRGANPTWTNDGRIAYVSYLNEGGTSAARFFVMDADGGNRQLVYEGPGDVTFGRAEWSPDGTRVVADATVNGNTDIYVLDLESQTPIRLTDDPAQDTSPTWSPDGEYIAFHTGRWGTELGHAELAVMRADGSGLQRITNDCFGDFMPSWVHNDTTLRSLPVWTEPPLPDLGEPSVANPEDILISGSTQGFSDLFAVDPATGEMSNLTADRVDQSSPAWSPDRSRIAFASDAQEKGNLDIYVMSRDGTDLVRLTTRPESDYGPAWSPDSSRIAFEGEDGVYVMNSDGTDVHHIAGTSSWGGVYPTWSPDGTRIAFIQASEIWVVGADGSASHVVLANPHERHLIYAYEVVWSPDGSRLLFTCERDLCLVDPYGSSLVNLTQGSGFSYARSADWSPDGTRIVFAGTPRDDQAFGLFVMNADGTGITRLTDPDPAGGCCYEPDW